MSAERANAQPAESPLRDNEEFRVLADLIPSLAWMADASGWIFWYNGRWHQYTGTTPEQMQGWGWQSVHDPASLPAVMDRWTACVNTGEPFEMVFPLRGADGVFRSFLTRIVPVRDNSGQMVRWFGTSTEIDELERTRAALERTTFESERQLAEIETIYLTAPIGLALFDLDDYHYLRLNDRQAAFFGLKPEQVVGRTLTEMAPIEGLRELFDQVARGEPVINFPLEGKLFNDPPDEHRYWTVSYFPVYAADGSIQAITAASLEVTAQKKAELALMQSEKLAIVGRLASSIAHEINNPLESVTNLLYLAAHAETLSDARHYIHTAEVELRRASAITSQTLRFHKQATSPQETDIAELVDNVLSVYQGRIANADIRVVRSSRTKKRVRCFEGEIRQVIANLVSNALDAMPEGGMLCVRDREAANWRTGEHGIAVTIADSGTGMSLETRNRLFNAFYTTKGLTGTGLGLWVTKEIVDRHRGTLNVRSSQSPRLRGTVFTLFLPFNAVVR